MASYSDLPGTKWKDPAGAEFAVVLIEADATGASKTMVTVEGETGKRRLELEFFRSNWSKVEDPWP